LLQRSGVTAAALFAVGFVANCRDSEGPSSPTPQTAAQSNATTPAASSGLLGFAFNTGSRDVTVFDVATQRPLTTNPLNAAVRWLSNEQRFWDGRDIWTYDVWDDVVQAIAIDPRAPKITRVISTGGRGPAHSLMLTPERSNAWLNIAGDNHVAVIDLAAGEVIDRIATGAFP
jgi:hypothetical protein